tara:strand:+ start:55 stop:264 length:210 start_codon:yes stop_codon:yes gene_type:complete
MKLYDTDYVIVDRKTFEPKESLDIIYGEDSLQEELQNNQLGKNEIAISMTKLPKRLQNKYLQHIKFNTT